MRLEESPSQSYWSDLSCMNLHIVECSGYNVEWSAARPAQSSDSHVLPLLPSLPEQTQ